VHSLNRKCFSAQKCVVASGSGRGGYTTFICKLRIGAAIIFCKLQFATVHEPVRVERGEGLYHHHFLLWRNGIDMVSRSMKKVGSTCREPARIEQGEEGSRRRKQDEE
jgi:hypothetical protein